MIAQSIGYSIRNLPVLLLLIALVAAAARHRHGFIAERFLSWMLLLPIGVTGLWAGWGVSPFQFEVGMADFAIGVTSSAAFWRDLNFKAAAVSAASIFLLGVAVGHVRQIMTAGNFAPDNAGVPFYMDVFCPLLAIALLVPAKRSETGTVKL
jgi:hypothetical protein